jgi:hypothetical protein
MLLAATHCLFWFLFLKLLKQVIREREKLYSLLRQTSQQRLKPAADNKWTIDPRTRYLTTTFPFNAVPLNFYVPEHSFMYLTYSFLLIYNKFCNGGGEQCGYVT